MGKKMWQGRLRGNTNSIMNAFNQSLSFDKRLYQEDIKGSLAHAENLYRQNILSQAEYTAITLELKKIEEAIGKGEINFSEHDEDIHMAIERLLIEKLGDTGARLHTGRSRNDQVNTDIRLYLKDVVIKQSQKVIKLLATFLQLAKTHQKIIVPGFTHLQPAQPITLSYYFLAYFFMLERDLSRLTDCYHRFNKSPLGSGAFCGVNYPTDRKWLAMRLGFNGVLENAMDAVADRDFLLEYLFFASTLMMHLSRLSEELIMWSSKQFDFIAVDEAFATGSSIMPNKKNPDVFELIRGKVGRVYGALFSLFTVMKGIPLAYNKDLQEDKEGLFDAIDQLNACLEVIVPALRTLHIKKENMRKACERGYLQATDLADYLVKKGLPFRKAHKIVGSIVRKLEEKDILFADFSLQQYKKYSPLFDEDVYTYLQLEYSIASKQTDGSTSFASVVKQIKQAEVLLNKHAKTRW